MAHSIKSYIKPLIGSALVGSSLFQLALPLLAQTATDAGEEIRNRATATYSDGTTTFNATSNEVTITVAEVAGIQVINAGINDVNSGSVAEGDTVEFDFLVQNIGNADTYVFIPGADQILANDNTQGVSITSVQIIAFNDTALGTAVDVPDTTASNTNSTENISGLPDNGLLEPGKALRVKVTAEVTTNVVNAPVSVALGYTEDNNAAPADGTAAQQNIPDNTDGAVANQIKDVRTLNYNESPNPQAPANGEREAANFQETSVDSSIQPLALASVFKTRTDVNDNGTTDTAKDDRITYRLNLEVSSTSPSNSFQAANLEGTNINLDGNASTKKILISDAIPAGTQIVKSSINDLDEDVDNTRITITVNGVQWQVVYSTQDPNTVDPLSAEWTTWGDSSVINASEVKRIGFIATDTTNGDTTDDALAVGYATTTDTTNSLTFQVITSGLPLAGGTVANIAQVFGQTVDDDSDDIIYDESGDQDPNNFQSNVAPSTDGSDYDSINDLGIADPNDPDANNNNTGTTPKGESNVVNITATPVSNVGIENGPQGQPSAIGPNSNQDDFQNQSTDVPPNVGQENPLTTINEVVFTNTVAATSGPLTNVVLRPISSATADTATGTSNQFTTDAEIPDDTEVTIQYNIPGGSQVSAAYTYDAVNDVFDLNAGEQQIVIAQVDPGSPQDYTVTVQLPDGTAQLQGFAIPVVAYENEDSNDTFDFDASQPNNGENTFNITINRLYTGYLRLYKESRILQGDGPAVQNNDGTFSDTAKTPAPGNIIEYRISYENISTPNAGTGNSILDAQNVVITEDGAATNGDVNNNWAIDNDGNGVIDTSNVVGSASDSNSGTSTIQYFNTSSNNPIGDQTGDTQLTDITRYVNTVTTPIAPGTTRTFSFQRQVN